MNRTLKRLKCCNSILLIILAIDLLAVFALLVTRCTANLWPNEEVWVNEQNKNQVEAYVASLNLPKDNLERVVYIPGLGDCEIEIYYKDNTFKSTGWIKDGYSDIFTQYGETEGTRKSNRILVVLLAIFIVVCIGKKLIGIMIENV